MALSETSAPAADTPYLDPMRMDDVQLDEAPSVGPLPAAGTTAAPARADVDPAAHRLGDEPDWVYLLREYYEMYRHSSAGGSAKIRAHLRHVRETISKVMLSNPEIRFDPPMQKPVTAHLKRALDRGRLERTATLIRAVESIAPQLNWQYGYEKVPRGLARKFAYAEILGPNGPVLSHKLILGLVLFAPKCTYPAHSHDGITESYFCLSGSVSENDDGVYAPGSLIFNPPGRDHRITVDSREPGLLAYAWAGDEAKLKHQIFAFKRAKPNGSAASQSGARRKAGSKS